MSKTLKVKIDVSDLKMAYLVEILDGLQHSGLIKEWYTDD